MNGKWIPKITFSLPLCLSKLNFDPIPGLVFWFELSTALRINAILWYHRADLMLVLENGLRSRNSKVLDNLKDWRRYIRMHRNIFTCDPFLFQYFESNTQNICIKKEPFLYVLWSNTRASKKASLRLRVKILMTL